MSFAAHDSLLVAGSYRMTSVVFRFGIFPTGILATSFRVAMSMADTELDS